MTDTAARLAIVARRNEVARFTIAVKGIDLTGVTMGMQVRLRPDTPGAPLFSLATVTTAAAEGLKLDSVTIVDGVPVSIIKGRINASTMTDATKVPYSGEVGDDTRLAYAITWTLSGDTQVRLYGDFIAAASAYNSDTAPSDRPVGYGPSITSGGATSGTLQFGDQVIEVSIDGLDQIEQFVASTAAAAASAEDSAALALAAVGAPPKVIATSGYTLALADQAQYLRTSSADIVTVAVPVASSVALPVGAVVEIEQGGPGQVIVQPLAGVTVNSLAGNRATAGRFGRVRLKKIATDTWNVAGDLAPAPFDGTLFDSARGDSIGGRFAYTPTAALTVTADRAAFSSASAQPTTLSLKDTTGGAMMTAFDYFEMSATFELTSFPAAFVEGAIVGHTSATGIFGSEIMSGPGGADRIFSRLFSNGTPFGNTSLQPQYTPGSTVELIYRRAGATHSVQYIYAGDGETHSRELHFTADALELPRLLGRPIVQFIQGVLALVGYRYKASFPNALYGFMGDSLTQGRFASAFSDAFPQLIRADNPGQVIVAGAPSAKTEDWLLGTQAFFTMKPRRTFIMLGTNDVGGGVPASTTQANLTTLRQRAIAAGSEPIMLTIPPNTSFSARDLSDWIKAQGWNVIDVYSALRDGSTFNMKPEYDSGDGTHLTTSGNLVTANLIRAYNAAHPLPTA